MRRSVTLALALAAGLLACQDVAQPSGPHADVIPNQAPEYQWVPLDLPGRVAPSRTWGGATFDSKRGQILYWGGGHCGYEGSDTDAYDVATHTWIAFCAGGLTFGPPTPAYSPLVSVPTK